MKAITRTKSITPRDVPSLDLYLKDVSKEKLISQEKEIELAKRIHNGDKAALDELVNANLRFVITVAKQYQGRGLLLEDLISEGNIGLIKSAEKFDETKDVRFISYAVWWIRQAILKAIYYKANNVRLPTSQIEPNNKLNKIIYSFEQSNERKPSISELAELSGFTEEYICDIQSSNNKCMSINTPSIDDSEDCTLGDCIPNSESDDPLEKANTSVINQKINDILNTLSNRDHDIICLIFGLNGCPELTPEEIARKFALSAERIRQILKKLIKQFKTLYGSQLSELLN